MDISRRTNNPEEAYTLDKKLVKVVVDGKYSEAVRQKHDFTYCRGLTMLHIAVIEGCNNFLQRLLAELDTDVESDRETIMKQTNDDDNKKTALHYAALFNNKRAAQLLVKKYGDLLIHKDGTNRIPLEIAHVNNNLDTFLYLWEAHKNYEKSEPEYVTEAKGYIDKNIDFEIASEAISTKRYDIALSCVGEFPRVMQDDKLMIAMARHFPSDLGFGEALLCPSLSNFSLRIVKRISSFCNAYRVSYACAYDVLWATLSILIELIYLLLEVILCPLFLLYWLLCMVLARTVMRSILKKRKEYDEAKEFMKKIYLDNHPDYQEAFIEAISQGAYDVVDEILYRSPDLIRRNWGQEDHSFIEYAIKNRSEKVYNLIFHLNERMDTYRKFKDTNDNNILHLAGKLAPPHILGRSTGAALQLQRELQWFQEVKKLMLPDQLVQVNRDDSLTPPMVFTKEHKDLLKAGEEWMKTTSKSCSIAAALIVTIVFAAAITVPGGNNQKSGMPLFKKKTLFDIFAVFNAISLFSGISALLVFLSILTTRFAEMDFLKSLPRRLILGLLALFLSTASMVVTFSAILFLVFYDQRHWMLAILGLSCVPIAVIVTLQFPLLVHLCKSTYIPIFGKQEYIASGKFLSKHPTSYLSETGAGTVTHNPISTLPTTNNISEIGESSLGPHAATDPVEFVAVEDPTP